MFAPLQALADGGTRLWVATTSAAVHGYNIPASLAGIQQQQQRQQPHRQQQQQLGEPPDSPLSPSVDGPSNDRYHPQQRQQQQQPQLDSDQDLLSPSQQGPDPLVDTGFSGQRLGASGSGRHVFGNSPSLRLRHSMDPAGHADDVPLVQPAVVVPGSPGLVAVRVLCDKRHLLTQVSA